MRRNAYIISCFMLFTGTAAVPAYSQDLHGTVRGSTGGDVEELSGAHVYWLGTERGTVSDAQGRFTLSAEGITDRRLVASHVSFLPDTLEANGRGELDILLTEARSAETVEVRAQAPDSYIAPMVQKTEIITSGELEKAACCDLSGCFGTTSSVHPESADIITDTKQLSMLGLEGVYTQVLFDNVPARSGGLNTHLGMNAIPGPLIDKIWVSKGATSILQGAESFSGQINVMLRDSDARAPMLLNAFANSFLERQYNAYAMNSYGNWSVMAAGQLVQHGSRVDRNGDSFLDVPLTDRASLFGKWKYADEDGLTSSSGITLTHEDRLGGQSAFNPDLHEGGVQYYGQRVNNERIEIFNASDIPLSEELVLKTHAAGSLHSQEAYYGTTAYDATEGVGYADASTKFFWEEEHSLRVGTSVYYSDLEERITLGPNPHEKRYNGLYRTRELVPGVFAENTSYFFDDALSVIAGARVDFRNDFGTVFTPRLFLRYDLDERTALRASVGRAFRRARVFVENPSYFASWRDIVVHTGLQPERALNYGVNATRQYDLGLVTGTVTVDAYRTEFSEQVIADFDADPTKILFTNLERGSASDNIMAEITTDIDVFSLRLSYTWSDVYEYVERGTRQMPFNSRHRVLSVLSMQSGGDTWKASVTAEWRGPQLLPNTASYPEEFRLPAQGEAYTLVNAHLQHRWEWLDIYAGVENILDFRQLSPIMNSTRPFDPYFEPTMAWGPVKGREAYAGLRLRVDVFGNNQ